MNIDGLRNKFYILFQFTALSLFGISMAIAQDEGEWTGRGWIGPSSGDSVFFGAFIVVAVVGGIIYLVNEGFPNFFPALGNLLGSLVLIFVAAQFITGILIGLGAQMHQDDSRIVFVVLLVFLLVVFFIKYFSERKKKNDRQDK